MDPLSFFSTTRFEHLITRLPNAAFTLVIGYIAILILQWLLGLSLRAARVTRALQEIIHSLASLVLWVGVIALVFQSLGLNQIAIALSSSVAVIGLGIATGANKLVSDVLAGLFLARSRDFKIGQWIKIDTVEGQIHSLDSRKVRVLGEDGTLYVIPNTKFDEMIWQSVPKDKKS